MQKFLLFGKVTMIQWGRAVLGSPAIFVGDPMPGFASGLHVAFNPETVAIPWVVLFGSEDDDDADDETSKGS